MQKSYFVPFCPFLPWDRADARQAARIKAAYLSHIYTTQNIIYSDIRMRVGAELRVVRNTALLHTLHCNSAPLRAPRCGQSLAIVYQ